VCVCVYWLRSYSSTVAGGASGAGSAARYVPYAAKHKAAQSGKDETTEDTAAAAAVPAPSTDSTQSEGKSEQPDAGALSINQRRDSTGKIDRIYV